MADTFTTNYNWDIPTIGTSAYAPKWNQNLQDIDTDLFAVSQATDTAQAAAVAAQARADGAVLGFLAMTSVAGTVTGSGANLACNLALPSIGTSPTYVCTFTSFSSAPHLDLTFTNRPVGKDMLVWVRVVQTSTGISTLTVRIAAASAQFALPFNASIAPTGISTVGTLANPGGPTTTYQAVFPIYIVGS